MGLFCGSAMFCSEERGKFPILKRSRCVAPSDEELELKVPIFISFDAMCRLTGLQGNRDREFGFARGSLREQKVNGKRSREDVDNQNVRPSYPTDELVEALFEPLLELVRYHDYTEVTIALICDASEDVPIEKMATQKSRASSTSFRPYAVDTKRQSVQICDEGLSIDCEKPFPIDMFSLMATRSLRPYLYRYFRTWIMKKQDWDCPLTLLFDAEFPEDGHMAYEYRITPNKFPTERCVQHSGTGEGEVSAMVWSLRFRDTHSVQLHSGDLDMLAIALLHGDKFKHDLKALLCSRFVFEYQFASHQLGTMGFSCFDIVLGSIMLGTDFVTKKLITHRANKHSVFEAARTVRTLMMDSGGKEDFDPLTKLNRMTPKDVGTILTVAHRAFVEADKKQKEKKNHMDNHMGDCMVVHRRIQEMLYEHGLNRHCIKPLAEPVTIYSGTVVAEPLAEPLAEPVELTMETVTEHKTDKKESRKTKKGSSNTSRNEIVVTDEGWKQILFNISYWTHRKAEYTQGKHSRKTFNLGKANDSQLTNQEPGN